MSDLKTKPTGEDVQAFLATIDNEQKRQDAEALMEIMGRLTGAEARLWGPSIIGFGDYHYRYESGREGDWFLVGFSPRKANLTLYIMSGFSRYEELMGQLGKFKTGKSCLYVKKLADINQAVLEALINASIETLKEKYGSEG
ncbi:MAG: DUF1801 domain-containing protein [Lewinella sp.]|nr:DUF1801 domain-containing protein [Lewinella sp.]